MVVCNSQLFVWRNVDLIAMQVPAQLRDDLQRLADAVGQPLSQYVREQLILLTLGRRFALDFALPNPNPEDAPEVEE